MLKRQLKTVQILRLLAVHLSKSMQKMPRKTKTFDLSMFYAEINSKKGVEFIANSYSFSLAI